MDRLAMRLARVPANVVRIKRVHTLSQALRIVGSVARSIHPVSVDFREIGFITPGSALLIAAALRGRVISPVINKVADGFGYASHIGFFDAAGIPETGQSIGEARGGMNYAPIRAIDCEQVRVRARDERSTVPTLLQIPADNLARVLSRSVSGPLNVAVTYAMREIMRNVVEHAEANRIWYAGQYWEASRMVEVAVLDEGIGFQTSLLRNPENVPIDTEEDAIRLAMRPGISSVPRAKRGRRFSDNSGFGLYITRKLCLFGSGSFSVVSNDGAVEESSKGTTKLVSAFKGSLVQMRLDISQLGDDVERLVERLAEEGESESDVDPGGTRASQSSRSATI